MPPKVVAKTNGSVLAVSPGSHRSVVTAAAWLDVSLSALASRVPAFVHFDTRMPAIV
jgi:hypothetical protein